jgi:hypothetical protein
MNNLSASRRAGPNYLPASIGLTVITAGLIWVFSAFNTAQAQDMPPGSTESRESRIPQATQAETSGIAQQRIRGSETEKQRPEMKTPRGSHIKQEIDQSEKAGPEPFRGREQPIQRKVPRALV